MVRFHKGRESYIIVLDLKVFLCKYRILRRTVGGINEIKIPNCGLQQPVLSDLSLSLNLLLDHSTPASLDIVSHSRMPS